MVERGAIPYPGAVSPLSVFAILGAAPLRGGDSVGLTNASPPPPTKVLWNAILFASYQYGAPSACDTAVSRVITDVATVSR